MKAKITQKTIAAKLGVSQMTVSLALRNHPSIPASRREEILKAAAELGYRINPMIRALMSDLKQKRVHGSLTVLGFLDNFRRRRLRREFPWKHMYAGAVRRAEELGYQIEVFRTKDYESSGKNLARFLRNRGMIGLLVGPLEDGESSLDFEWEQFCSVAIGSSLLEPRLHRVINDNYQSMQLAFSGLKKAGHQRIGFVSFKDQDERSNHLFHASFLMNQRLQPKKHWVEPLVEDTLDEAQVMKWMRREKPDAIISQSILEKSRERAASRAKPIEFLKLGTSNYTKGLSIDLQHSQVGAVAAETLIAQLERNQIGIPTSRLTTLVEGVWSDKSVD